MEKHDSIRIAILISGEYRTFKECRKTMHFLDNPAVDIYISTWDKTFYTAPKINYSVEEDVTIERIRNDLGKDAVIDIQPHDTIIDRRYSSKMIYKWKRGLELIRNTDITYDFLLIIRPDLYFRKELNSSFDFAEQYTDVLGCGWYYPESQPGFLNDVILFSSFKKLSVLLDAITVETWWTAENDDWHTFWYSFAKNYFHEIQGFAEMDCCNFFRPWANDSDTYQKICQVQEDWSDLKVLAIMDVMGREHMETKWPIKVLDRTEQKWNDGIYEKYDLSNRKLKVALIISGMLRCYDTALLSLDIWGECDKFLVTWESAGQIAIDDYSQKVDIKQKFIVSDAEFEEVYTDPCKNGNNTFRMVYLWNQAYKNVPKDYDKYIIIRPDGFYWSIDRREVLRCIETEGPFKIGQLRRPGINGLNDHYIFINNSHFRKLENCYEDLRNTALLMIRNKTAFSKNGNWLDPHEMLYNMWNQNLVDNEIGTDADIYSTRLYKCIEPLWVRNTFRPLNSDRYNRDLYNSVFYDTAVWWRNEVRRNYSGIFNRLDNIK